ncbi:peptide chain release factor N(5)-glutamine methyltransferase [Microbacterium sp. zg.Y625]|uniref:peptide chain release factor N(5)-glutamine methyltransferase n=1 Tax=Microbacterium jiangjiandongii TaxID=3049071 RepID=UPI00214BD1AF|nr:MULTISPECIES: peptide chain release factor N(5)-glutamine methyltransferase [unclassified Microbacterium]MCR2793867.1 peptide chain release factor N(5)-glutamine methyltransferase [Microbacterium sp. zg.Y625]MCR2816053.1 peptide chain release factor N(5)-glutamine methyltransferase [Microbacterium sp. zg.Y843]WIM26205.1 peptide chain release factor N(5)-glutamine methyltransferase [Microbacterium sp. zg-Y625]
MPDSRPAPAAARVAETLRDATGLLQRAGVASADVDAQLLLAHVLGVGRGELHAAAVRGDTVSAEHAAVFADLLDRRAAREPLQHLTGLAPFRHLELKVGPGVFVPRPETETVAQIAIDALSAAAGPNPVAVDLGTGSGAIALALATEVPHARVYAAENSVDAFVWAKENFRAVGAPNARIAFVDLAEAFPELDGTVSVVVSNPPYVPEGAIPRDPEVRDWDPPAALYGGADGLDVVRVISGVASRLLHPGGTLVLEHGEWQGAPIRELLAADGWRAAATHQDLTLRDRATTAVRA